MGGKSNVYSACKAIVGQVIQWPITSFKLTVGFIVIQIRQQYPTIPRLVLQ